MFWRQFTDSLCFVSNIMQNSILYVEGVLLVMSKVLAWSQNVDGWTIRGSMTGHICRLFVTGGREYVQVTVYIAWVKYLSLIHI